MTSDPLEETNKCNGGWKFALFDLADSHYAAVCTEDDQANEGAISVVIYLFTVKDPLV